MIQTVAKVPSTLQHEQIDVNFSNIHVALDINDLNRLVMVLILRMIYTGNMQYAVEEMRTI